MWLKTDPPVCTNAVNADRLYEQVRRTHAHLSLDLATPAAGRTMTQVLARQLREPRGRQEPKCALPASLGLRRLGRQYVGDALRLATPEPQ